MDGITCDHEILTKTGWKCVHDIKVTEDELYACEVIIHDQIDPLGIEKLETKYLRPLKINFESNYKGQFYNIKNEYIDIVMNDSYKLPCPFEHHENRYENYTDFYNIDRIKSFIDDGNKLLYFCNTKKDKDIFQSDIGYNMFSLKPEDIKPIIPSNTSIFNILMPSEAFYNYEGRSYYRVYVRRNNKEFWM